MPFKVAFGNSANTQFDFFLQILTAGIIGLLIGEAIHSLATIVERRLGKLGKYGYQVFQRFESYISSLYVTIQIKKFEWELNQQAQDEGEDTEDEDVQPSNNQTDDESGESSDRAEGGASSIINEEIITTGRKATILGVFLIPLRIVVGVTQLLSNSVDIFYPALQPHRIIFNVWVVDNYGGDVATTWSLTEDELLRDKFAEACSEVFAFDIYKIEPSRELYTTVATTVNQSGAELSQRFQDLYTFCRSMWVVLLILSMWLGLLVYTGLLPYEPWWMVDSQLSGSDGFTANTEASRLIILSSLFVLTSLFFYASSRYKQIYVKYLIADMISIHRTSHLSAPD